MMCVKYLAVKRLPFQHLSVEISQEFCDNLRRVSPNYQLPNRNKIARFTVKEFQLAKNNSKDVLKENNSKLAFTIECWTSKNSKSYYGVTVHYIDGNWKMQSVVLYFIQGKGQHSGLSEALFFLHGVRDFDVHHKISGITGDNVSSNSVFLKELFKPFKPFSKGLLKSEKITLNAEDKHFRCFAHLFNLGAQEI